MEKFKIEEGSLIVINHPKQELKKVFPAAFIKQTEIGNFQEYLFYHQRFFPGLPRKKRPDFILNQLDSQEITAHFLLVSSAFGLDDDEDAGLAVITALKSIGLRALIGRKFGEQFKMNALKKGLLIIELTHDDWQHLIDWQADQAQINPLIKIDLINEKIIFNHSEMNFTLNKSIKNHFLKGEDQISYSLQFLNAIKAYEENLTYNKYK